MSKPGQLYDKRVIGLDFHKIPFQGKQSYLPHVDIGDTKHLPWSLFNKK